MDELFVWDVQLAERAGIIAAARLDLVHKLQDKVQQHYQTISTSTDGLQLTYDITFPVAQYSDRLLAHLRSSSVIDRQRGFTGTGPHREDLLVALKGADARQTASRGERRSIILALKIRELELLYEQTGTRPILLLDDVFSELDGRRRRALAESLVAYQTFLTTTDADVAVDHFSNYNIIPMG
jgi:DNA replication and repair protein RecF